MTEPLRRSERAPAGGVRTRTARRLPYQLLLVLLAPSGCGGCDKGGFFVDAPPDIPPEQGGKFSLAWTVTDSGGQPISCSRIGGQSVSVALKSTEAITGGSEAFACSTGMGTSGTLLPGRYLADFELTGQVGSLGTAPQQTNVVIRVGETTMLEPVTFAVEATGGLALHLSTGQPGGNCGTLAQQGAGITGTSITLVHTGGGCEPITLSIGAGATQPASSYTINCSSPTIAPCIENDQAITASGVPSDQYSIHVRGKIGPTDCWTNDDALAVPPLMKVLTSTLNLAKSSAPGC
jgi:hypothetical protein